MSKGGAGTQTGKYQLAVNFKDASANLVGGFWWDPDINGNAFAAVLSGREHQVSRLERIKGNGKIRIDDGARAEGGVRSNAAWHIQRHNGGNGGVYHIKKLRYRGAQLAVKTRAENRIHNEICGADCGERLFVGRVVPIKHGNTLVEHIKHFNCTVGFRCTAGKHNSRADTVFKKLSCNNKAVAAVVAASANHHAAALFQIKGASDKCCGGRACIFHKPHIVYAYFVGKPFGKLHFSSGIELHNSKPPKKIADKKKKRAKSSPEKA